MLVAGAVEVVLDVGGPNPVLHFLDAPARALREAAALLRRLRFGLQQEHRV